MRYTICFIYKTELSIDFRRFGILFDVGIRSHTPIDHFISLIYFKEYEDKLWLCDVNRLMSSIPLEMKQQFE